jgi:hypothetical protein
MYLYFIPFSHPISIPTKFPQLPYWANCRGVKTVTSSLNMYPPISWEIQKGVGEGEVYSTAHALSTSGFLAIYGPTIYTAQYIMLLMRENPLQGQVVEGWALEIEPFLGPVKWPRDIRQVPFGTKKSRFPGPNLLPLAQVMDLPASKALCTVSYRSEVHM